MLLQVSVSLSLASLPVNVVYNKAVKVSFHSLKCGATAWDSGIWPEQQVEVGTPALRQVNIKVDRRPSEDDGGINCIQLRGFANVVKLLCLSVKYHHSFPAMRV